MAAAKTVARRGPKSVRGKITASMNSTKHGITSVKPVITHFESENGWKTHRQSILDSLDPANGIEQALAERVALNSWRLNRVAAFETMQLSAAQEDLVDEMRRDAYDYSRLHDEERKGFDAVEEAEEKRAIDADLNGVYMETIDELESQDTMEWIYENAPFYALWLAAYQADPEKDPDEIELELSKLADALEPSFRERLGEKILPEVGDLRDALKWLAHEAGVRDDILEDGSGFTAYQGLMEKLCAETAGDLQYALKAAEKLDQKIAAKRRRKVMLDEDELQKLARYEAHLSREMFKALHELEALQKRRAGEPTPLARVDLQGALEAP